MAGEKCIVSLSIFALFDLFICHFSLIDMQWIRESIEYINDWHVVDDKKHMYMYKYSIYVLFVCKTNNILIP